MAKLKNHFGEENGLVEPSPHAHPPDGIYVARTLVQDFQEVPPGEKFIVDTDASNVGIGVLSQVQDGQERVTAYFSKTLNKVERNYCVSRPELLAIVRTLEHFHKYLYGQQFNLRTDHSAFTWLMSFKNLEGQTARWIQRLQEYNFTSEHRQGWRRNNADALSRRVCKEQFAHCDKFETRADVKQIRAIGTLPAAGWDPVTLRDEQLKDPDIWHILQELENGQRPKRQDIADWSPTDKSYWAQWKSLSVRNGVLERDWEFANGRHQTAQIIIPRSRVKDVLSELHGGPSGGHFGVNKTQ
ncbi:uncharacterized protein LOC111871977 [Cryptotermes secundus]|uniref:uncharacterized protein LOC111871977 n=1 Tax=Cryptotermes secundus TaxID=105785 RepID=UPI000CD7B9EF|nr:uncharacterized protein LOC111871977 [Cryptotermes secundus]